MWSPPSKPACFRACYLHLLHISTNQKIQLIHSSNRKKMAHTHRELKCHLRTVPFTINCTLIYLMQWWPLLHCQAWSIHQVRAVWRLLAAMVPGDTSWQSHRRQREERETQPTFLICCSPVSWPRHDHKPQTSFSWESGNTSPSKSLPPWSIPDTSSHGRSAESFPVPSSNANMAVQVQTSAKNLWFCPHFLAKISFFSFSHCSGRHQTSDSTKATNTKSWWMYFLPQKRPCRQQEWIQ